MATTWIKPIHKGNSITSTLKKRTDYAKNFDKTEGGELIVAFECDEHTVDAGFLLSKRLYEQQTGRSQGKKDVVAYHIRQSFKPGEVTAEQALKIGYDLAMRWTKGKHQFIVAAHTNTNNPHIHIVFNSTSIDHTKKFRNFKFSSIALRRLSDQICLENGLSIIEKPKPSKGFNRNEYLGDRKPPTVREQLQAYMDSALTNCTDFDAFLAALETAGVEVKRGKQLTFKLPGGKKFIRQDTLGDDYTYEVILERISGKRVVAPKKEVITVSASAVNEYKPNLLIDIQAKLQQGKGEGYEHWARIFNLKESAKTLIFLKENGIDSYDDLVKKSSAASAKFTALTNKIKTVETRMVEITELQKHIGTYGKTRDVYKQYLNAKNRESFFEEHRADITLHNTAKKYFDEHGYGKNNKLPTIASLKQGWATLAAEKKKLYSGYRNAKSNMIELVTAKSNADKILSVTPEHNSSRSQKRSNSNER